MNSFLQIATTGIEIFSRLLGNFWLDFKGFLRRNKYGVMGTIAFHMGLFIILILLKLNTKREFSESQIFIEIPPELIEKLEKEEQERIEQKLEEKKSEISESVDELLRSIAVNQNVSKSPSDPKQNIEKMIEEIKNDLDEYGSDEGIGKTKGLKEYKKDSLKAVQEREKQRILDSLESIEYSGPSSVYYSLEGRHKIFLPIPVFTCEGEGLIVVQIWVTRDGKVIQSKILKEKSGVEDECLFEAALLASRKTRFNVSSKSPEQQQGTITYHFVKQ